MKAGTELTRGLHARIHARRGPCELDLEIEIAAGETLVLVGPNGAGKSTLVDVLTGLAELNSGRIEIGGIIVDERDDTSRSKGKNKGKNKGKSRRWLAPQERGVALMPQGLALFPHMSALDNVAYGLLARGVGKHEAHARARSWLSRLDIAEYAECSPAHLSGGQAQRVALARAVITEPALLLLDEPLSALDVSSRRSARAELQRTLRSLPGAKLVITHDARDLAVLADRVAVLEGGQITCEGTRAERLAEPHSSYLTAMLREQGLLIDAEDPQQERI